MISLIVPVFNVEKYIVDCLRSIITQSYKNFELILIDDGSTDNSMLYAEDVLKDNKGIDVRIIRKQNGGVSSARNAGLEVAKGDFVIMIDSDDVLSPTFLELYKKMIDANPMCNIYSSGFKVCYDKNDNQFDESEIKGAYKKLSWNNAQLVFFNRTIKFLLPTLLINKSFLDSNNIRFDTPIKYSEDVQFIWRCLAYNRKNITHSPIEYYHYILHSGSTMTASNIEKIETGFSGLERLYSQTKDKYCTEIKDAFLPRQYFSILHGASKILSYHLFSKLYKNCNCDIQIKKNLKMGTLKMRVVTMMLLYCRPIGYCILRIA